MHMHMPFQCQPGCTERQWSEVVPFLEYYWTQASSAQMRLEAPEFGHTTQSPSWMGQACIPSPPNQWKRQAVREVGGEGSTGVCSPCERMWIPESTLSPPLAECTWAVFPWPTTGNVKHVMKLKQNVDTNDTATTSRKVMNLKYCTHIQILLLVQLRENESTLRVLLGHNFRWDRVPSVRRHCSVQFSVMYACMHSTDART